MCCTRLTETQDAKNCYIFASNACIDHQEKKLVKQQYLLHVSSQYGELTPTNGWDRLVSFGHPSKFQRVSQFASWIRCCTDVAQRRSTKLCTMFRISCEFLRHHDLYAVLQPSILPRIGKSRSSIRSALIKLTSAPKSLKEVMDWGKPSHSTVIYCNSEKQTESAGFVVVSPVLVTSVWPSSLTSTNCTGLYIALFASVLSSTE